MQCELCSTSGEGGGTTRCPRCGFDTTLPPDVKNFLVSLIGFRPGELVEGRFRIDRILGYGGMSVVYKAHDEVLGETVAIKVINRGRMCDDNKFQTDIRRDIVTTRKLAHPDIVKIFDFHKTDTCGFLTMEYVPGDDVASLIAKRGRLAEAEVCRIALQVAEALSYAHANGVVHCDIKPGNLLLTESGTVKIADFGISRLMHEENTGLTGLVVGTPAYMAPEQIRGERPGPRTDMYSLGIVMWHCLMGAPPFIAGDIAYQHVHVPLPPLTGVSPEVEGIIRRAASKAMDDRYPSMAVMAQELREVLRRQEQAVDATLVQTPAPGFAATLLQPTTPPLAAGATVLAPVEAGAVAAPAATVAQATIPAQGPTVAQTPPRQAGAVAPPPPGPPAAPVPTPPTVAAGGGAAPPVAGAPPAARPQPAPAAPPPSSSSRVAAVAAIAVLLAGAAVWGLFFRSSGPGAPREPLLATGVSLPPAQPPAGASAPEAPAPPPERAAPAAATAAPARTAPAAAAAGAAGAVAVGAGKGAAERPAAAAPASVATVAPAAVPPPVPAAAPASLPAAAAPVALPVAAPAAGAGGRAALPQQEPPGQTPAPVAKAVSAPASVAPSPSVPAQPIVPPPPPPAQAPAPAPVQTAAPPPQEPARTPQPAAARDLGAPIQTAALPRGRWCDLRVRAVGTGAPMANDRTGLSGERSATLDAYRRILEYVKGVQVSGGSTVKDFITTDATYRTKVEGVIRGARQIDRQKNVDGTWSVVLELNLAGMCDVIQGGTP